MYVCARVRVCALSVCVCVCVCACDRWDITAGVAVAAAILVIFGLVDLCVSGEDDIDMECWRG